MAGRTLPGLGLVGFYNLGEDGWGDDMSNGLRLLSAVVQLKAISLVASEPESPADGDIYILTGTSNANKLAVRDNGEWVYITPAQGWIAFIADTQQYRKFVGTSWSLLIPDSSTPPEASEIPYNGGSGGPENVQDALDELFVGGGGGGIPDAPIDGELYARRDGAWESFTPGAGGSGGGWEIVEDITISSPVANIDITGLGEYEDLLFFTIDTTISVSAQRHWYASVDGGSTFYNTSGDYQEVVGNGSVSAVAAVRPDSGVTVTERSGVIRLLSNVASTPKFFTRQEGLADVRFAASEAVIDAMRLSTNGGVNYTGGRVVVLGRKASSGGSADFALNVITSASASYTPTVANGKKQFVRLTDNSAVFNVPDDATQNFDVGTVIDVQQVGTGPVTFDRPGGVTVQSREGADQTAGQFAIAAVIKVAANTWVLTGDVK